MRKWSVAGILLATLAVGSSRPHLSQIQPMFDATARKAIAAWWAKDGRYVAVPTATQEVRQTPEGSAWIWKFYRARGKGKVIPTGPPIATTEEQADWDKWLEERYTRDWAAAEGIISGAGESPLLVPTPEAIEKLFGEPPVFAEVVEPVRHTVKFDSGEVISLPDNPVLRKKYAYYRYKTGVMSVGKPVKSIEPESLKKLFADAGVSERDRKVMMAVSSLEGGFDSINTYDTGYVSVGFIQFACLSGGGGSLGQVMRRHKRENPAEFERLFRKLGMDVTESGLITVYDPLSDRELVGGEAAKFIIDNPAYAICFQMAGRDRTFQLAQIAVAHAMYIPTSADTIQVRVGADTFSIALSEVMTSEAGLAVLMDRRVNTGTLEPLGEIVSKLIEEQAITDLADLAKVEGELVARCKFRKDTLSDPGLSQPPATSFLRDASRMSRSGDRTKKGGGG